jgi:hypothetical protein
MTTLNRVENSLLIFYVFPQFLYYGFFPDFLAKILADLKPEDIIHTNQRTIIMILKYIVNLCLVIIKYKNPSWTNKTVPQKFLFDFKE